MDVKDDMKALLIGIDAGCLSVFERLYEADAIPNIRRICEEGISGPLESQIPPWTPSAWPSMYTGVNPGKHGVYGFVDYDGYDWHVVSGGDVKERALWSLLDEHGMSSVVVNVPVTHPPDEIDGAIVPGFIGPEDPTCHPRGTLEELRRKLGEYRVYPAYSRGDKEVTDAEKMDEYCALVGMRSEAFRYLVNEHEPDFGFVQFQKTDTVFHEFDGDPEKVERVYRTTDEEIGRILDEFDPEQVFIASDHGMGPYEKYEFRINEYLRDKGYVEITKGGKGMPSWNPIRDRLREGHDENTWEPSTAERLAAYAAKFGLTAERVGKGLKTVGLDDIARRYAPENVTRTANEQVDFPNSIAYMRARTELGVRINLEGREPAGVVPQSEYDTIRADLIEYLRGVSTPDGDPMFEDVAPREEYFHGPYLDKAVDIVTVPNNFEQFLSAHVLDGYFAPPTEPWNHKLDGVFAAKGVGIDTAASIEGAHLFDVAPTIMSALGIPYSDRMDGRVLPIVSDIGSDEYDSYDEFEAVSEAGDGVQDRLADLGYLE
ncbi:alkaline phosphatase family protein [Halegenticoccus tardaugens]|uniref:alkaline phosphatase family protein n=1 Tax=Halegenticoccus tardaugens TaxID=2071624 RepID=UPI001E51BCEB|nr:alkaline phosphatase family protein [Halegenticoccus tardaugens]